MNSKSIDLLSIHKTTVFSFDFSELYLILAHPREEGPHVLFLHRARSTKIQKQQFLGFFLVTDFVIELLHFLLQYGHSWGYEIVGGKECR